MSRRGSPVQRRRPRPAMAGRLFVFVLEGDGPGGFRRSLLAFACARTEAAAGKLADDRLLALGWSDLELQGVRPLDLDLQAGADPHAVAAMAKARETGFSMIVY